jgi:copper chaperone CopZ
MEGMEKFTQDLPVMYGDHHVVEVRRILLEIPGVEQVYASSGFRAVEVSFDPEKTSQEEIIQKLDEAGYTGELDFPTETGEAVNQDGGNGAFYRHTAVQEKAKKSVGFTQKVSYSGRPLWPCPGVGTHKRDEES